MMFLSDILKESFPELRKHPLRPVKVAVIDSGIDSTHEVLRKKVAGAWEFQEENGTIVQKALPQNHNNDAAGHGTAVASIIAKIAPNVRILDFKVLNSTFSGTGKIMLAGLKAAIESDAKIINMSLVCLAKYRNEIAQLLEQAYQKHKIVIASKRNTVKSGDLGFPAELSSCISVDNHSYENNPYYIEHIDEQPIEFAAHGENVLAALHGGGYYRLTGTSFATPMVSGNAALLLGKYPELELFEIKAILKYHSQKNSFRSIQEPNPLEVAEHSGNSGRKSAQCRYRCPYCQRILNVHEAFSFVKCPDCKNIFSLFSGMDKRLGNLIIRQLTTDLPEAYIYHNARHTKEVLSHVHLFMQHYTSLTDRDKKCLLTAALLHDTGYLEQYSDNEQLAVKKAEKILPEFGYTAKEIKRIQTLISATAYPCAPKTLPERILCDADLGHVGLNEYLKKSELLRKEKEAAGHSLSDKEWLEQEIEFLSAHKFHQRWLEAERKSGREKAIRQLKTKLKKQKLFLNNGK